MVGCIIQTCRGGLGEDYIARTHKNNSMRVALAPGDGLLLEKVGYEKYNSLESTLEPIHVALVSARKEVDDFREDIVSYIASRELISKAFIKWASWFDDNCSEYYCRFEKNYGDAEIKE